jgi:hypothetical protein
VNKRLRIVFGFLLASVLLASFLIWYASRRREPVFEGRPLSRWLDHHVASSAARPPYDSPGWRKADEALRTIGTNGISTLLEMISAKDPPAAMLKLIEVAQRHRLTYINYRYAIERNEEAEYAFRILGTNAVAAVPGLIRIYEKDISPSSQSSAALALGHIGRGAQAALPALIRRFNHTNKNVRFYAVSAVMHIGGDPEVVIPALTGALKDSNVDVRWNALSGLSRFFSRARSAVPEISKMLNDPGMVGTSSITQQVQTTLWRIAPEKVGKPLVVEEATPLIRDGKTTEALKMTFYRERKTLIPSGKPVPTLAQYWNSDPRPSLKLYRGPDAPDGKDHFLGEFQVMGLPEAASANLNVSTLCVVADGQIILCARDNHNDQFLEIRRVESESVR